MTERIHRRPLLALPALIGLTRTASAAELPSGPIRVVVGFAAGGGIDTFARITARAVSETSGRIFVVENRPGGSGTLAALQVANSPPDGRTIFLADSGSMTVTSAVMVNPPLDPRRDLAPLMLAALSPQVLVSGPRVAESLADLIAKAKQSPGRLTYASAGAGNATHLLIADFTQRAGIELVHVPYRGGSQMATSVMQGETDLCLLSLSTGLPHLQSGRLRALAVAAREPLAALPDVPTLASVVPGAEASGFWYGLNAPGRTPEPLVAVLHAALKQALEAPATQRALAPLGVQTVASSPAEYRDFVERETVRRTEMARAASVVPE